MLLLFMMTSGCHKTDSPQVSHLDPPGLAAPNSFGTTQGVPVICYHYFRNRFNPAYLARVAGSLLFGMPALSDREFWTIPVGEFEKHLKYFRDEGIEVMTLDEVQKLMNSGMALPPRAVVLTIDDAEASTYSVAYPLLRKFGMRAHLFVPTAEVGHPWSGLTMCTWSQLQEMERSGFVILESHTNREHFKMRSAEGFEPAFWNPEKIPNAVQVANLKELNALDREVPGFPARQWEGIRGGRFQPVTDDLLISRAKLAERAGAVSHWLAWPYGYGNGDLDSIAAMVGFSGTVSLKPQTYGPLGGPWHVGRYPVTATTTLAQIKALFPFEVSPGPALAHNTHP